MFTGIIEGMGTLAAIKTGDQSGELVILADYDLTGTSLGDSIAVNGACLTVTALQGRRFTVDVSPETFSKTTFGQAKMGQKLNLERALRLSDRLDGHLVSGHVDGVGQLKNRRATGNAVILTFTAPQDLTGYMINKGSVALDGISLTINQCHSTGFEVSIIPHTAQITTIGLKETGESVNIETDIIGKYVQRFLKQDETEPASAPGNGVDLELLAKSGYLK